MRELLRRIQFLFHRAEYERELEEEMRHHLALLEEGRGTGAAGRQFGNVTSLKEESRSMWTFAILEQFGQDLRYAMRAMVANPLFTATAVVSLALGIGANTAIYSFMNAILLRALPVSQPEQLAIAEWHSPRRSGVVKGINGSAHPYGSAGTLSPNFPYPAYEILRSDKTVFSTLFAYTYVQNYNVIAGGQAESVAGGFVSGNYFSALGIPPAAGRLLDEVDDRTGAQATVVLAYAYWQRRFNRNPAIVGAIDPDQQSAVRRRGRGRSGFLRRRSPVEPQLFPADSRDSHFGNKPS